MNIYKPRIICTLGTTTDDKEVLRRMVHHGMNCARINTAYATIEDYSARIGRLKEIADIPVMMDIKGPQIRLKSPHDLRVNDGDVIMVGFNKGNVYFNKDFYDDVECDDVVLFENGTIKTVIIEKKSDKRRLSLLVETSGDGNFHRDMGVNVPGKSLDVELFSAKDLSVIDYAVRNNIDYIAQSFVRSSDDVRQVYAAISESKKRHRSTVCTPREIGVIAKIENQQGIDNLEDILKFASSTSTTHGKYPFSVMVARGDLHVELDPHSLPFYQKHIIKMCHKYSVPVIVATGFLESMNYNPYPTRAEISDVANTVIDGADAIMLSGETSNSKYPAEAVLELSKLMKKYEHTRME